MKGSRPEPEVLRKYNDLSKKAETRKVVTAMVEGRIADNCVMVDFPHVMQQLGVDAFAAEGWEKRDPS